MHYLAFSLGHKLHSSILLIYFVCMKQIELLHASRSRLTEISLLYSDATNISPFSILRQCSKEMVNDVIFTKLIETVLNADLQFMLADGLIKYFHLEIYLCVHIYADIPPYILTQLNRRIFQIAQNAHAALHINIVSLCCERLTLNFQRQCKIRVLLPNIYLHCGTGVVLFWVGFF